MKKHFLSLMAFTAFLCISGFLSPLYAQNYCKPTFSAGGCNGTDISSFSFGLTSTGTPYSVTPSCISGSPNDTTGLSGSGITVYRGKTYQIRVFSTSSTTSFAAYIDYQKSGSFEDIGDFVASETNGTFDSMVQNITIPIDATPTTTRMRVIINNINAGLSPTTDCGSFSVGGSEDYKLTITAFSKDIAIRALTPAYCPNSKEPVKIIIRNIGLNNLSSIPFTFKVGSTTVNSTYSRLIASNSEDTFTVGTFNASTAGTYNLKIYANLTGDGDRSNDTISATLHIAQPAAPTINSAKTHCGPGSVYLNATSTTTNSSTYWFKSDTAVTVYKKNIDSVKTPFIPIGASDTLFAESRFATNTSITKGTSYVKENYGNVFDIFAKNIVIIDSFDVEFVQVGSSTDSAAIYYKTGTYHGFENDQAAWIHFATIPVKNLPTSLGGNPTRVRLTTPLVLQTGTSYGFYITPASNLNLQTYYNEVTYDNTVLSTNPLSNADMTITAGASLGVGKWGAKRAITNGRDWAGTIYYHINACPSPRVPVSVKMLQNPNGAYLAKGIPFGGKYNKGDEVHADQICVGDTSTYIIEPPTGMAESDYGTKWVVNSIAVATVRGTLPKNVTTSMPTTSKNGFIQIYPSAAYNDSVFVIGVDMKTPGSGCDSVIYRFVTVNATPAADFSFTNPCGNIAVDFADLSSVKSNIDTVKTWLWDFGDGSTTNLNRKTPFPHLYPGAGSYNVKLTVTSSSGCPATVAKTLNEFAVPVAKFGTKLACNTRPISFVDSSSVASPDKVATWNWTFGDNTGSATQNPVHSYPKSGPYTVGLVVTSNNGCKDSLIKSVRVQPLPEPKNANGGFTFNNKCVGATIPVSPNIITDSTPSVLPTFTWNFGDGTANVSTAFHAYTKNGTYTIMMIVKGGDGCIDTFSKTITPFTKPVPKITFDPKCVGQTVHFVDSSGSGTLTTNYDWDFGDGATALNIDSPVVYHAYAAVGIDTVKLSITNGFGCTGAGSTTIFIPGYPTAAFTAADVCVGGTTVFKNASTGVSAPGGYAWDFGDTTAISTSASPTHKYASAGNYNVKLVAVNQYLCANADSVTVNVNPLPAIAKWTATDVHYYLVSFVPKDTSIGSFKWYFGDAANDSSSVKEPKFTYPAGGTDRYQVRLVVTNSFGCSSERTDSVFTGKYSGIEVTGTTFDGITVFPNPFEGTTNITYTLPARSNVNIGVYNAEGKLVARLKDGTYGAGSYTDAFDAKKYNAAEGVYYLKMYVNDKYYTTKIINLK